MAKKYLYGNLNQDTVRPNYGGSTSDSVTIRVDNDKMVISGEVNWDAALGELAHKAYPGDKGARNYQKIVELSARLEAEVTAASTSRSTVESKVGYLEKYVKEIEDDLTTALTQEAAARTIADTSILEKCIAEATRAIEAEKELLHKLETEISSREAVDTELLARLNELSGLSGDSLETLQVLLTNEIERATQAENNLTVRIAAEEDRSATAESEIRNAITNLSTSTTEAIDEVTRLATINASTATGRIIQVEKDLQAEAVRAIKVENDLLHRLNSAETDIVSLSEQTSVTDTIVSDLENNIHTITLDVAGLVSQLNSLSAAYQIDVSRLTEQLNTESYRATDKESKLEAAVASNSTYIQLTLKDVENIAVQLGRLEETINTITAEDIAKASQVNEIKQQLETVLNNVESVKSTLDTEIDRLTAEDTNIKDELNNVGVTLVNLRNEIAYLVETVSNITTRVSSVERTTEYILSNLQNIDARVELQQDKIDDISSAVDTSVDELKNSISVVQQDVNEVSENLTTLSVRTNSHDELLSSAAAKLQQLDTTIEELVARLSETAQYVEAVEADVSSVDQNTHTQLDSINTQLVELITITDDLKSQVSEISESTDATTSVVEKLTDRINLVIETTDNLTAELEALKSVVEINTQRITNVASQLETEIERSVATDLEHSNTIQAHAAELHRQRVDIETNELDIYGLKAQDVVLAADIKDVKNNLESDIELRNKQFNSLVEKLALEIKRSVQLDETLTASTERNSGRITTLQVDLTNVITNYVNQLMAADDALSDRINDENEQLLLLKEQTADALNNVVTEALDRDNKLQAEIELLQTSKDSVQIIPNDGTYFELYAQRGDTTSTIPLEKAVVPEAVVRRDSVGNVLLTTDDSTFTSHSAVSKLYVDNIIEELREELSSVTYDFIDGGNAPVG